MVVVVVVVVARRVGKTRREGPRGYSARRVGVRLGEGRSGFASACLLVMMERIEFGGALERRGGDDRVLCRGCGRGRESLHVGKGKLACLTIPTLSTSPSRGIRTLIYV